MRKHIYIFFSFVLFWACSPRWNINSTQKQEIKINDQLEPDAEIAAFIAPYQQQLDKEMNEALAYNPYNLHKKGYNSPIANLLADAVLDESNQIYSTRHKGASIDICLLNHGGIRRTFSPGMLSLKSVYELMPFENEVVVVTISGEKFLEMIDYLKRGKKGHPISGITFSLKGDETQIMLGEHPFDVTKNYTVVTNDYLQKGGDHMDFFANPIHLENLNIKLRDMYIQYFQKVDTIKVNLNKRYQ